MWRAQVAHCSQERRVIALDLRGHGRSAPATGALTLYDMVDDALAVLDHLGIDRAVWGGLSIGGMIAMRAALRYPSRVAALMLLDSHAGRELLSVRIKYAALAALVRTLGIASVVGPVLKLMFGATSFRKRPDLVAEWRQRFMAVDAPSMLLVLDALVGRDSVVEDLAKITVPALVLVGAEDLALPPERSREIAAHLADSEFLEVAAAGHLSTLEAPAEINEAIGRFLQRLP
jgi:pimeloyl-ACP methyl ester carboxylesterase